MLESFVKCNLYWGAHRRKNFIERQGIRQGGTLKQQISYDKIHGFLGSVINVTLS